LMYVSSDTVSLNAAILVSLVTFHTACSLYRSRSHFQLSSHNVYMDSLKHMKYMLSVVYCTAAFTSSGPSTCMQGELEEGRRRRRESSRRQKMRGEEQL